VRLELEDIDEYQLLEKKKPRKKAVLTCKYDPVRKYNGGKTY
jgi:hypothetical protein